MFCPKCGNKNDNDNKFCLNCGANLHEFEIVSETAEQKICNDAPATAKKISSWKVAVPVISVIGIVIAAMLLIMPDPYVKMVQEGSFLEYPNVTVEEVISVVLPEAEWESIEVGENEHAVVVQGRNNLKSYRIQFAVNDNSEEFEVDHVIVDGRICSSWGETVELAKWFIAHAEANSSTYEIDLVADFLNYNVGELCATFKGDYEMLGAYSGAPTIEFSSDDSCPYLFSVEPGYDFWEIDNSSMVLAIDIAAEGVLINEELTTDMTYSEIKQSVKRGYVDELETNEMYGGWSTSITYDDYYVAMYFSDPASGSYSAFIKEN